MTDPMTEPTSRTVAAPPQSQSDVPASVPANEHTSGERELHGAAAYAPLIEQAVELAHRWALETERGQTDAERQTTGQLAALVRDPAGLDMAVHFVDKVARPEDTGVAARELRRMTTKNAASFLGPLDRAMLGLGSFVAPLAPPIVVPLARMRLRQIIGHLVVDAHDPALGKHLAQARADGFRLNVNLLGEAVLGEREAASRTARVNAVLARDDVDYVSIKVSSLVSQISAWDHEGTVEHCLERLRPLYRTAMAKTPHSFVNLDMEEYKDLDLTMDLFTRLLSEEEFHHLEAGIVLQAYLPDALPAMERLIEFSRQRRAAGGASIKIRLVKGANLAMERVESAVHDWAQATYLTKADVDANYLRCVERALRADSVGAVRLGVASHNLFDVAAAYLLAKERDALDHLDIEMLQGMAPAQSRAIKAEVGTVLLYTPVVAPEDFDVAVSYLIRRLEENASSENFLHAIFADSAGQRGGEHPMAHQEQRFRDSVTAVDTAPVGPRRSHERAPIPDEFDNTPDSDPSLPATRQWAAQALSRDLVEFTSPMLQTVEAVQEVVGRGTSAAAGWRDRPVADRVALLRAAARSLEERRGDLLTVMAHEGGKTVEQADPEISEAIDFARYYADRAEELAPGAGSLDADGARFTPSPLILITPPWNFPVAIPIGGVLAALAAGSAVIIKPALQTARCVEVACDALFEAGIPRDVLQVVRSDEGAAGKALVSHPQIETVVLTGASDTARLFAGWRLDHRAGPRVYGETSGKNALVVTPSADLDLAVADLVKSAFGHAGQKCSAASLGILVGSVATSERFRRQLIDGVASLRVGWPTDLSTTMGPLIEPPSEKLMRALTTLEPGESWLVEPRQLDDTGRLWSPGLKDGVAPGSFFHLTEVFGPVLGLMRAGSLDEAIDLQNATAYGLTGGLHSLDPDEIERWSDRAEVGNGYINRHITGAIVRRQSFGGWKASVVGPGAKAGGPNYVAQLGSWAPEGLPQRIADPESPVREAMREFLALLDDRAERTWLRAAAGSDAFAWLNDLSRERDESGLVVETNVFRYRPVPVMWVRAESEARPVEIFRLVLAGLATGADVRVSLAPDISATLKAKQGGGEQVDAGLRAFALFVDRAETSADFVARVERGEIAGRLRVVGGSPTLLRELAEEATSGDGGVTVFAGPVLATGRRELLTMLREQAISRTMHRFGVMPSTSA